MGDANRVFDTKLIRGPPQWDGSRQKWRHWSAKVEGYIASLNPQLLTLMEHAAVHSEAITHVGLSAEHVRLSGILYGILNALTESDAYETVLSVTKGNGLEAWRLFARDNTPRAPGSTRSRLMWLINPVGLQGSWKNRVNVWERYERE